MTDLRINIREADRDQSNEVAIRGRSEIAALVGKAAGGSFEAFGELYHIYIKRIYRYVLYQVKDRMKAEDITADVFVKALDAIGSCRGKESTFSAWLYRIAYNTTIDSFRKARRSPMMDVAALIDLADPSQEVGKDLEWQELREAVAALPENQRQVIILKFNEGLNNREVAQVMGKSEVAVRLLQLRALTALRDKLVTRQ